MYEDWGKILKILSIVNFKIKYSAIFKVYKYTFHGEVTLRFFEHLIIDGSVKGILAFWHFSRHSKLSSDKNRQLWHVWAAFNKSLGSKYDKTYKANYNQTSFNNKKQFIKQNIIILIIIYYDLYIILL